MAIPQGFSVESSNNEQHCLQLLNNLYGQKQAGRVWNKHLTKGLLALDFVQSKFDPCVFWRKSVILVIYTDDTIVTGKVEQEVEAAINDIGKAFKITSQNVKITRDEADGSICLTQPQLIDSILNDLK
jgi:Reverse transcriptase (RNA-dependent DNA polymerase)